MLIKRSNGRIYFGEGRDHWSVKDAYVEWPDSELPLVSAQVSGDMHYLVVMCPDTNTALEKLRLIRWAVRHCPVGGEVRRVVRSGGNIG